MRPDPDTQPERRMPDSPAGQPTDRASQQPMNHHTADEWCNADELLSTADWYEGTTSEWQQQQQDTDVAAEDSTAAAAEEKEAAHE